MAEFQVWHLAECNTVDLGRHQVLHLADTLNSLLNLADNYPYVLHLADGKTSRNTRPLLQMADTSKQYCTWQTLNFLKCSTWQTIFCKVVPLGRISGVQLGRMVDCLSWQTKSIALSRQLEGLIQLGRQNPRGVALGRHKFLEDYCIWQTRFNSIAHGRQLFPLSVHLGRQYFATIHLCKQYFATIHLGRQFCKAVHLGRQFWATI